jgi:hypothetical protein
MSPHHNSFSTSWRRRRRISVGVIAVAAFASLALVANASPSAAASTHTGFGFNARDISGFPTGHVFLTGGGVFDSTTGFVHSGGGFRCTQEDVQQGPLNGCLEGQGVRWDTANLLRGTMFKCTGAAGETLKPANTGPDIAVLAADFYRAGDGNDESFNANMIVAAFDIAPDIDGVQNVWVQGVGCATAVTNFSS